jgi:transposase
MAQARGRARRRHSAELKAQVLAECAVAGASVAAVALSHGLNANLVHRWRRIAEGREAGPGLTVSQAFVALPLGPSDSAPFAPAEIRIELRRAGVSIGVAWPVSAAGQCAAWLRELLR